MPELSTVDYQALFDAVPNAYIVFGADDPDFTIVAENKAHMDVALAKKRDVVGKPVLEAFPDTSRKYKETGISDLLESVRTAISTGKPDPMEVLRYDIPGPDGRMQRRYWQVTHYPIHDAGGKVTMVCQATVNITERIQAGRRAEEAQRQLDEALSIGLIGTWLWNLEDDYVVADRNLLKMFGLKPEDVKDGLPIDTFTDAIVNEDRPRVTKIIKDTVAAKSNFEAEYRTMTHEGEIRWVIARGRVETDDDGKAVRFPGVIVDVTERKQTEGNLYYLAQVSKALGSSLDYNRTLRSIAKMAVPELADWCTIDILEEGKVKLVAVAHKTPSKVAWAKKYRKSEPVDLDAPTGVAAVLRTGKSEFYPVITDEMLVASARNDEQLKLIRSLNITSAMTVPLIIQGETIGAITFISSELMRHYTPDDLRMAEEVANRASLAISNARLYRTAQDEIAARAVLEDQLRVANEALEARVRRRTQQLVDTNRNLERSNQELQDFAYVASHDLQEPLRKIQAFGNLLQDEYGGGLGEGRDYLDRMRNAASRMSVLIEDLLSFSRVTTKARPLTDVDLNVVAAEVLEDLEIRVKDCSGTVEIGPLPTLHADELQMRQLMQNLISNALKFARPDESPRVRIYAKFIAGPEDDNSASSLQQGDHKDATIKNCQLFVEDNGIGFDEKYLDRIFSVFQRLHGKDSYQGTGIGLAICRKIVERHGGSITARSKPGKGSTFIVTLPTKGTKGKGPGKDND